jgi:hypothetical protein
MNTTLKGKITYIGILLFVYVLLPMRGAFAQPNQGGGNTNLNQGGGNTNTTPTTTTTTTTTGSEGVMLENPLAGNIDSIPALVKSLLNIVLIIGTPLVALAIIFAGFMLVAAQGNPEKLQKARQALLWAIVGGAILLGAYVIAQAIGGTVEQLTS